LGAGAGENINVPLAGSTVASRDSKMPAIGHFLAQEAAGVRFPGVSSRAKEVAIAPSFWPVRITFLNTPLLRLIRQPVLTRRVSMLRFLDAFLFGCFHARTTFPMTLNNRSPVDGVIRRRTYVACLHCGEELAYNWQDMKLEGPGRSFLSRLFSTAPSLGQISPILATGSVPVARSESSRGGWGVLDSVGTHPPILTIVANQAAAKQLVAK
jgi:hypothetical protein